MRRPSRGLPSSRVPMVAEVLRCLSTWGSMGGTSIDLETGEAVEHWESRARILWRLLQPPLPLPLRRLRRQLHRSAWTSWASLKTGAVVAGRMARQKTAGRPSKAGLVAVAAAMSG